MHFTLIIVFVLISWTLSARLMPEIHPGLAREQYWIIGIFGSLTVFFSVLLHELAHSVIALKYGVRVYQIMLFIFGGISDIEEKEEVSKDFRKEFMIAVVGPVTSFVLAAILTLASWILTTAVAAPSGQIESLSTTNTITIAVTSSIKNIVEPILQYGAVINTVLGGFNLVPAFPLDGGRILRSALLRAKKDYYQSTKITVRIGIAISYGFMAFGFITVFSGSFISGMWILFIGWFLNSGAQSYLSQFELSSELSKVRLRDVMNPSFVSVKPDITVGDAVDNFFNIYRKSEFPVVEDKSGHLLGIVTAKQTMAVQEYNRSKIKVGQIMIPKSELIVMEPNRPADEALRRIFRENKDRIFVCEDEANYQRQDQQWKDLHRQVLVGVISKTDLLNIAKERAEFEKAVRRLGRDKYSNISNRNDMNNSNGDEVERGKIIGSDAASSSASSYSLASLRPSLISRKRVLLVVLGIILFLCAYSVGSMLVKISNSEAQLIKKQFREQIGGINGFAIFLNNIKVASGMFIPGFGIGLGTFSGFSTGIVFTAISETSGIHRHDISPLMVFLTPFGILEVIAYGIAISRSGILSYQLIRNKNKRQYWKEKYLIPTMIELGLVIVILIAAATIEWQIALQLGSLGSRLTG